MKSAATAVTAAGVRKLHQKVHEVEHENVGIKAGHRGEQALETTYRGGKRVTRSAYRFVKNTPYRTVHKLEEKALKADMKLAYEKAFVENPKLRSNVLSRMAQKLKIRRQYAVAVREAKETATAVQKPGNIVSKLIRQAASIIRQNPGLVGGVVLMTLMLIVIMSGLGSCSNMVGGMLSTVISTSYLTLDEDINNAELIYTEWETDLQLRVDGIESSYRGYDEYRYSVDDIGHYPYELMAYLTAYYQDFSYSSVVSVLRRLFAEQYQLTLTPETEVRYREETQIDYDFETGEPIISIVQVPYDWRILNVEMTAQNFTYLTYPRLTTDQQEIFNYLMRTKGNRQYVSNPLSFNWLPHVTYSYGYRIISTGKNYHTGVDISVATGTNIMAGLDGKIVDIGYIASSYGHYVVVENDEGVQALYAHCNSISVSIGQTVKKTDVVAKSGNSGNSSGPHLHFEVRVNGQHLNPLYFAETGDDGSGYNPPGTPGGIAFPAYPGEPITEEKYAAMMKEAQKHLGKPYVFGAKGPNKFDCSGFVCYVLRNSGVKKISTNAQGLYNACTPVSRANAKPGDLIFFTKTYSTKNTVTHVGIYIGNNKMIHAGKPVQYASINTSYFKKHFYAFGRLSG